MPWADGGHRHDERMAKMRPPGFERLIGPPPLGRDGRAAEAEEGEGGSREVGGEREDAESRRTRREKSEGIIKFVF